MSERGPDHVHDAAGSHDADADEAVEDFLDHVPGIIAILTLGIGVTTAILGYGQVATVVFVVGWLLLTPLTGILADTKFVRSLVERHSTSQSARAAGSTVGDDEAALEELKRRYARGEIDEAEFERRTAMLLENDSIEAVEERVERTDGVTANGRDVPRDGPGDSDDELARDRNREREYET